MTAPSPGLTRYTATAIAIHRMSAATTTGEYEVYLAADVARRDAEIIEFLKDAASPQDSETECSRCMGEMQRKAHRLLTMLEGTP